MFGYTCKSSTSVTVPLPSNCYMLQRQRFQIYYSQNSTAVLMVLLCSSIVALSYNVIHSLMIQKTSAVTTTVLGEVKIVGLLILSALLLGKPLLLYSLHHGDGCTWRHAQCY